MNVPASQGRRRLGRAELKQYFRTGLVPTEQNFADLIDAFVLPSELPPALPTPPPVVTGDPDWLKGLRIGHLDPAEAEAMRPLDRRILKPACRVPADGAWHAVLPPLNDCCAFEITGCASSVFDSGRHALTHAVALTSYAAHATLRQQYSAPLVRRWRWLPCFKRPPCCRIEFRWERMPHGVALQVRTSGDFGADEEGRPVMIDYHLTRLW